MKTSKRELTIFALCVAYAGPFLAAKTFCRRGDEA